MWLHLKREIIRFPNSERLIAKKRCYNKQKLYQTPISSLFVLSLDGRRRFCVVVVTVHGAGSTMHRDVEKYVSDHERGIRSFKGTLALPTGKTPRKQTEPNVVQTGLCSQYCHSEITRNLLELRWLQSSYKRNIH